ncbi:hypothetical protein HERIO_120 [Hepatospora eriocheir]|uniref:Uncharacterized protein n=1 Tax=Hepatospora eriocheir TaxID=1081669 RepID=A0A1X0QDZ9_9MICR|nr:hypothetical protein HERIO_120 [Hepatospora eriocheir]
MTNNYQQQNDQAFNPNYVPNSLDNRTQHNPDYNNNHPNDNRMSYQNSNNQMQQPFEYNDQALNPNKAPYGFYPENRTPYNPGYNNNQHYDNQMSYQNPYNQMQQPLEYNNAGFSQNDPSCKEKDEKSTSSFWGTIFSTKFLIFSLIVLIIIINKLELSNDNYEIKNSEDGLFMLVFILIVLIILILFIKLIIYLIC